ncbi:hypothetical protein ABNN70_06340 [Sporolactobacillus sp. Y61]|uniref:Uncharacterized protein n=1 Tax=Sporolactobacillus sp. Y61 TaxID=3160863 RepID=A0AAU8IIK7_9BACL
MKQRIRGLLMIHLSFKKLYGFLTAFTLILPFLYIAYLFLTMLREKTDFHTLLLAHPLYSVMFLAVMLNILWGYLLFRLKQEFDHSEGRNYTYAFLALFLISQLLVGNIAIAIMAAFVMMHTEARLRDGFRLRSLVQYRLYSASAAGLILLSLLCSFAVIRLTFFA